MAKKNDQNIYHDQSDSRKWPKWPIIKKSRAKVSCDSVEISPKIHLEKEGM